MENLKEIFEEFNKHLIVDSKPSVYFNEIVSKKLFLKVYPLTMLWELIKTPQSPVYHPEGSVWNHTMMVVDEAARRKYKSQDYKVLMWTALLHDIGKASTTKLRKGKITSYDHDKVGKEFSIDFLKEYNCSKDFIIKVSSLVRWHMNPLFIVKKLPFADIKGMISEVSIEEIALFSLCDRLGRGNMTDEKAREVQKDIKYFIQKCKEAAMVTS
jgi:putative nucleotidyltransferase with HDIG domain